MKIINVSVLFRNGLFAIILLAAFSSCKKDTACNCTPPTHTTDTFYDVTDGLVAYYNFNGGSIEDSSGFNNDVATNTATLAADRFGRPNNAYDFNGTSSSMRIPASASLNLRSVTLHTIFKIRDYNYGPCHNSELISKGYPDNTPGSYNFRFADYATPCNSAPNINNEKILAGIPGAGINMDTVTLRKDTWYHAVYTFDGLKSKLYLNGQLKAEQAITGVSYATNTFDVYLGRNQSPTFNYFFNGVIDEVRIYNRALSLGAIKQLYNSTQ